MKILILNQAFYPDLVATALYASDLGAALAAQGHQVTALASVRGYSDPDVRFAWSESWRGVNILRCPNSGFGKDSRWKRALNFASFLTSCAVRVAILPRFDAIITLTSPPLISALAAVLATLNGARLIYWVMDLNPDEAIASGWLRPGSRTTRGLNALLGFSLRKSDEVVVLDRFMATRLARKGVPASKLSVVPLWPHDDVVCYDPAGAAEFRKLHGLEGKFVVMYSGNHSPCHPLTTLLEAMSLLQDREEIVFCFIGGGSEFPKVKNYAAERGLSNVRCLPYQPLTSLSGSLSSADLHVVIMGDAFVGIVHPSKIYNIHQVGAPFLYIGPLASSVAEAAPQSSFRHGDVKGVAQFILNAASVHPGGRLTPCTSERPEIMDRMLAIVSGRDLAIAMKAS